MEKKKKQKQKNKRKPMKLYKLLCDEYEQVTMNLLKVVNNLGYLHTIYNKFDKLLLKMLNRRC